MTMEGMQRFFQVRGEGIACGASSRLLGILNVTPDSFSDGGRYAAVEEALARAGQLLDEGCWAVDVGGESTRPGFEAVSADEEIARVVPVIEGLLAQRPGALVSVDTSKAEVARAACRAGAAIVNDVWGFLKEPELAEVAVSFGASALLMSNQRDGGSSDPVLDRIRRNWERSLAIAARVGLPEQRIVLDPGLGFGTTREEDLEILRGLDRLAKFGFPLMLGASRKRITAEPMGISVDKRLEATLATTVVGISKGVDFFRVHDAAANRRAADMADLIYRQGGAR